MRLSEKIFHHEERNDDNEVSAMKRLQLLLLQSFVVVQLWQTVFISTRREVGEGGGGGGREGERGEEEEEGARVTRALQSHARRG